MRTSNDRPGGQAPSDGLLARNLLLFVRTLRRAGAPVGPGEALAALRAVEEIGLSRREDVRAALRAALATSREQALLFDRLFDLFWRSRRLTIQPLAAFESSSLRQDDAGALPPPGSRRLRLAMMEDAPQATADVSEAPPSAGAASYQETLRRKDFAQMSPDEARDAAKLIQALRFEWDDRPSRRWRSDDRGTALDPKQSLRKTLRGGGAAIALARRSRKPRRPPIVALCDISGSMSDYSRLILLFLHTLTKQRPTTKSFLFGTRLTDATRAMRARDPDEALALAARLAEDWSGGTRISSSLSAFRRDWSRRVLGQGAVVILFTDGLERDPGPELARNMRFLHASCRRLIWLNPLLRYEQFEPKAQGVKAMLPHVDAFLSIHSAACMEDLAFALAQNRFAHAKRLQKKQ